MLATVEELSKRLVQPPTPSTPDYDRAEASLEDASALVLAETGQDWDEDSVPAVAKTIVLRAAIRAYLNPTGVSARSMGPFSEQIPDGVYLTADEQRMLERFEVADTSGIQSIQIDNPVWKPRHNDFYVHDQFGGDWIAYIGSRDFGVTGLE